MTEEAKETGLTTASRTNVIHQPGQASVRVYDQAAMAAIEAAQAANTSQSEINFSRVGILQPGSPEIAGQIPGYSAGMLVDNLTREILTSEMLPPWMLKRGVPADELRKQHVMYFLPVFKLPNEYIKWKPYDEGGGWEWKTLDVREDRVREGIWPPRGIWQPEEGEKKSPPVTENINIMGLALDEEYAPRSNFIVATFARTSYKTGKLLVTAMNANRLHNLPPWGRVYYLSTHKETEDRTTWYQIDMAAGDLLTKHDPTNVIGDHCFETSLALSDKELGRGRQEMIINTAFIETTTGEPGEEAGAGAADGKKASDPF